MAKTPKRQYDNDYVSVTGLLSLLTNYGLQEWFKRTPYNQILEESNKGKLIGSQIHDVIQSHIEATEAKIETEYPDEVTTILKSFMLFKKENPHIKLHKAEIMLISDKYKINGTLDAMAEEDEENVLVDWKSGKCGDKDKPPIYDSYIYQASCYSYLHIELNKIALSHAYVIALAKDKIAYNIQKISPEEIKDNFENVILPLLQIYYYQKEKKEKK